MKKTGIVYVLHGRRGKMSIANVATIEKVIEKLNYPQEIGYLEGPHQPLEEALKKMAEQVQEVLIVPILLFPASHFSEDLPKRAATVLGTQPYLILPTLGTTKVLFEYLVTELRAEHKVNPKNDLLLVIHGSARFTKPQDQLAQLAEQLAEKLAVPVFSTSYIVPGALENQLAAHPKAFSIKRIFLSHGRLAKRIVTDTQALRGDLDHFLPTLQDQPVIEEMILERLEAVGCTPSC